MIKYKPVKIRSPEANRYYHGVLVNTVCQYKSWTHNKAHEWIKETWDIESTAELKSPEFWNLIHKIRIHCFDNWALFIDLPD